MPSQADRTSSTQAAITGAFRGLILAQGFRDTNVQQVAAAAGISKGAIYHHFARKEDILAALYAREAKDTLARAHAAVQPAAAPLVQLHQLYVAWFDAALQPDTAALLFQIGPAALGVQEARALEAQVSRAWIDPMVRAAVDQGHLKAQDCPFLIRALNAVTAEAVLEHLRSRSDLTALFERALSGVIGSFDQRMAR